MSRGCVLLGATALILVLGLSLGAQRGGGDGAPIGPGGRGGLLGPGGRFGGPARDTVDQPAGTATIRGRILTADTAAPVRRAQVRAVSSELRTARLASTDAQGRFELKDLPAGRWTLTAAKAGFVSLQYGQRRPFESGRPVEVADGQAIDRIDFALPRGSVITGHVYDEFGEPVANARVQVLRFQTIQGTRRVTPSGGGDQSDDTGAFRLYGLSPGDYFVSATLRAGPGADNTDGISYAPTYYPGTGNVSDAQRLTLAVGQEQANVNFALLPVRTVRVSGLVIGSAGNPLTNAIVSLVGSGDLSASMTASGSRTRQDGSFMLTNVSPGSYTLTASTGFGGPGFGGAGRGGGAGAEFEIASMPVVIGGDDLTGVTLLTSKGGTVSGRLAAASGSSSELRTGNVQVTAQPIRVEPGLGGGARPSRLESDGTFRLTGLTGPRLLRVSGLPQEWMLEAVMLGGTDITDAPIDFKGSEDLSGVQLLVTDRVAEVSGKVLVKNQATRDYTVVIFPEDQTKWAYPSRFVRSIRGDQQGQFRIRGLPAEQHYLAIAVDYLEDGEGADPQFLEQVKDRATKFSLTAGESKAMDLTLVAR